MANLRPRLQSIYCQSALYALTALIAICLYVPFLDNALVFDDHNEFSTLRVYNHAITIFNLAPRTFPYFTLGFTQVVWKTIEAHRIVSLLLHLLNTFLLFRLLERWLVQIGQVASDKALILAFIGSMFFAIHPVAVYGAGYLIQRTTLFATFFSLMSLWFYWRGLARNRFTDSITAALFYTLAIFSKEHAIMLPAVALLLTPLHETEWRQKLPKAALFAALCVPVAVLIVLTVKRVIGTAVEPESAKFISSLSTILLADSPHKQWGISAVTQAGVFFRYLQAWLLPDVRNMSADIRMDFLAGWAPLWITIKVTSFLAYLSVATYLLRRRGRAGLVGFGMLYTWLLFLTEFSSIRFQEPVVLYRSYLWAPGIIVALMAALSGFNRKPLILGAMIISPLLFLEAHNRLQSFKSELALWEDVVAKLPSRQIMGTDRIFYNRGVQFLRAKRFVDAISDFSESISQNPSTAQAYQQRGIALYSINDYQRALEDFNRATALDEKQGLSLFGRAMALEKLGHPEDALSAYKASKSLGYLPAQIHLDTLQK